MTIAAISTLAGEDRVDGDAIIGKFPIVYKSHELILVPWQPIIDPLLGGEVTGIAQGDQRHGTCSDNRGAKSLIGN